MNDRKRRLRHALDVAGLTIEELCAKSTVSRTHVFCFSRGDNATLAIVERLAKALNVSASWLAWGVDVDALSNASALLVRVDDVLNPESHAWVADLRRVVPGMAVAFVRADAVTLDDK